MMLFKTSRFLVAGVLIMNLLLTHAHALMVIEDSTFGWGKVCNLSGNAYLKNSQFPSQKTQLHGALLSVKCTFENFLSDLREYSLHEFFEKNLSNEKEKELLRSIENDAPIVFKESTIKGDLTLIENQKVLLIDTAAKNIFVKNKKKVYTTQEQTKDDEDAFFTTIILKGKKTQIEGDIVFEKGTQGTVILQQDASIKGKVIGGSVQ